MTDVTLDELRGMAPEQELTAELRQDTLMIWGPHANPSKPEKENDAIRAEVNQMKCHVCKISMTRVVSDLPFRVNRSVMIILRDLPLLQCTECGAYAFEEKVMKRVHEIVEQLNSPSHLDAFLYGGTPVLCAEHSAQI